MTPSTAQTLIRRTGRNWSAGAGSVPWIDAQNRVPIGPGKDRSRFRRCTRGYGIAAEEREALRIAQDGPRLREAQRYADRCADHRRARRSRFWLMLSAAGAVLMGGRGFSDSAMSTTRNAREWRDMALAFARLAGRTLAHTPKHSRPEK